MCLNIHDYSKSQQPLRVLCQALALHGLLTSCPWRLRDGGSCYCAPTVGEEMAAQRRDFPLKAVPLVRAELACDAGPLL